MNRNPSTLEVGKQQSSEAKWIWFQEGAREGYAVPAGLAQHGRLECLVTDLWVKPGTWKYRWIYRFYPRIASRFNEGFSKARVYSFNFPFLIFKALTLLPLIGGYVPYNALIAWYFERFLRSFHPDQNGRYVVFAYNYIAWRLFIEAKKKGYSIVLGQIDAGPEAGEINRRIYRQFFGNGLRPNPDLYRTQRKNWDLETGLADLIVVNSPWSKSLISRAGVAESKISIIPVSYSKWADDKGHRRQYPTGFSKDRPMKVLFLGALKPLKGIMPLLDAARRLRGQPIRLVLSGVLKMPRKALEPLPDNVEWIEGGVPGPQTGMLYRDADVFILPTFSDGFAITQLEAQAWKLPVISTPYCGEVVTHGVNGILLQEISAQSIASALMDLLQDPAQLQKFSDQSIDLEAYKPGVIASRYLQLFG